MDSLSNWFDFNDVPDAAPKTEKLSKDEVKRRLLDNLEGTLYGLFPAGRVDKNVFVVGDVHGTPGQSLKIELKGAKKGVWKDHATDDGGDIFGLFAAIYNLDTKNDFKAVLDKTREWLGEPQRFVREAAYKDSPAQRGAAVDTLGPHVAKYDYTDARGNLIACAYKYLTANGKTFRIWDVKDRKWKAPNVRPLYNQPGIARSDFAILCEGEKCADALISMGYCATTAIGGAKAPLDKTDWSPLKGKTLAIWPDNDQAGKDYAKAVAAHLKNGGLKEIRLLTPSNLAPAKWDAADAVEEGFDIQEFLNSAVSPDYEFEQPKIVVRSVREMINDLTPRPPDLIAPRVLGPGDLGVIAGAPKVGKSDFIMSAALHWASGLDFLGLSAPRPLRILYIQAEIGFFNMRDRLWDMGIDIEKHAVGIDNLVISDRFMMILDDDGVEEVLRIVRTAFKDGLPDLVIFDPLRNLFDGGDDNANENDNSAMMRFITKRILAVQNLVSKEIAVIVLHHTKKVNQKAFNEDPFQSISGAGALRGFYSAGFVLNKPKKDSYDLELYAELRNGPPIDAKIITKKDGQWIALDDIGSPAENKGQDKKSRDKFQHRADKIEEILLKEALYNGKLYTRNAFAGKFQNTHGLGSTATITRTLRDMLIVGTCKFTNHGERYGQDPKNAKDGYLVVDKMSVSIDGKKARVKPSHFVKDNNMVFHEVENPDVWVLNKPGGKK